MVSRRLRVIKAHVAKLFTVDVDTEYSTEIKKLEALSKKAHLDVSSLHKAYDLLYKCSQQLNSIMAFPFYQLSEVHPYQRGSDDRPMALFLVQLVQNQLTGNEQQRYRCTSITNPHAKPHNFVIGRDL
ncbi:jg23675 [Pararge aegeria aegeria]|uniref:Jg23675 protein n=1 Tax=Pararge aegeria aegeria TaxID=348720 RepID=A0A8S4REW2_9NEOP|nr:jg23675 [Pararge aegeria aegeria]